MKGSFLKRVDTEGPPVKSVDESDNITATIEAVKFNLQQILNTRQGSSESAPSMGLLDFNDATGGSTDFALKIARNIKDTIEAYESRVRIKDVVFIPTPERPLDLNFKITGVLSIKHKAEIITIELLLDGLYKQYRIV